VARAIWSGTLSFGLVSIPVRLFPATAPRDVRFHQFDRDTGRRIRYRRVAGEAPAPDPFLRQPSQGGDEVPGASEPDAAPFDRTLQETAASTSPGPEVPFEDVVKGFEVDPGRFVMVGRDELEAIEPERSHTVEIEHFVSLAEIDPIHFDRSYYVAPQRGAERPYALLLEAMRRAGRVAIARFVLRTKQHLAAIRALDDVIVLETLFYADEIRELKEVDGIPTGVTADDRELDLADKLIGILETSWDPSSYRDEYRQRVLDLIEARAQSEGSIAVAEGAPEARSRLPELLAALRASVEQAQEQTKAEPDHKQSSGRRSRRRTG